MGGVSGSIGEIKMMAWVQEETKGKDSEAVNVNYSLNIKSHKGQIKEGISGAEDGNLREG